MVSRNQSPANDGVENELEELHQGGRSRRIPADGHPDALGMSAIPADPCSLSLVSCGTNKCLYFQILACQMVEFSTPPL